MTLDKFFAKTEKSGSQLGVEWGVTRAHVSMLRAGKRRPSIELAQRIARTTGLTLEQIFNKENGTEEE